MWHCSNVALELCSHVAVWNVACGMDLDQVAIHHLHHFSWAALPCNEVIQEVDVAVHHGEVERTNTHTILRINICGGCIEELQLIDRQINGILHFAIQIMFSA